MSANLSPLGGAGAQFFTNQGVILSGGKLFTYQAGTTTPQATWTDSTQSTPNPNPIILDSAGRTPSAIWLAAGVLYKFVLTDSTGALVGPTFDNIGGILTATPTVAEWVSTGFAAAYISTTSFSVPGDQRVAYSKNRRVQAVVNSGNVYGTIVSSTYAPNITTVTLALDSTLLDATLSAVNVGFLSATFSSVPGQYVTSSQIQSAASITGVTGGTADAITATFNPTVTALAAGLTLVVRASAANVTTTPTFQADSTFAKTIVKAGNAALQPKDIAGAGHWMILTYDAAQGVWVLENPATWAFIAGVNGAPQVGFQQLGATTLRTLQAKGQESISVKDFGAVGSPTDDSTAFQAAVNALPAGGGTILVPDGAYVINTAPTWGTKSIQWLFGPNATVTGTQSTFPRMNTNTAQVPVGPWVQSQSTVPSPGGGGIAAVNFEMIQPVGYNGQSVALYAGARGSSPTGNVWAMNPLIQADVGAGGTYQCLEIDVNNFAAGALVKGISINGVGTVNPTYGIEIIRTGGTQWITGLSINNAILGINLPGVGLSRGISIGTPAPFTNCLIAGKHLSNGGDSLVFQRFTDTAPTGYHLRVLDAANSTNLLTIDTGGNISSSGNVSGGNIRATSAATAAAAGVLSIGGSLAATATAGGNGAPPAQVAQYLILYVGATQLKIPAYNP
jgi:hypothetical protein